MRDVLLGICLSLLAVLTTTGRPGNAAELRFVSIEAAPWAWFTDDGRADGVFPALVTELERRTGHTIVLDLHPFVRIERALEAGSQDCTIIAWNPARAAYSRKGAWVVDLPVGVVAAAGVQLRTYDDLAALRGISVLRGLAITPRFDADPALARDIDTDYLTGLHKLARGHVQGIAGAVTTIRHLADRHRLAGFLGDTLILGALPLTLHCSMRSPHLALMDDLDRAIAAMQADGTLDALMATYYPP